MMRARQEHGFTLIEMLVAMSMALVVFAATITMLSVFQRNSRNDQMRNETQDAARTAVDRLARQLRNVIAPNTKYNGALEQAEPYSLTFQTIDSGAVASGENAANAMRVRYCLNESTPNNEVLWMQVERWETAGAPPLPSATACPDPSTADWESSSRVVEHVTNNSDVHSGVHDRPLFTYGGATKIAQITSVEPEIFLALNPGGLPGETRLTTAVFLRNENRQPTASFTTTQLGSHPGVQLNASGSRDPDGLALTYRWWEDATELSTTAQEAVVEGLAGSTHTFKLEVADAGGLTNTFSETVTINK
jgi:prepilin-type N-terminal cleavage/methylation domain-containing protein